jgi:hypothetical protein
MSKQQDEETANLRELLRQHWDHCRHLEYERTWFMLACLGAMAAFVFGMSTLGLQGLQVSFILQLSAGLFIVISFFGFFLTIRWIHAFECHREKVNKLALLIWKLSSKTNRISDFDPTIGIPPMKILLPKKWKKAEEAFRTRYGFPSFYLALLLLLAIVIPCWPLRGLAIGLFLFSLWLLFGFIRSLPTRDAE